jgi:hypothetical protein
MRIVLADLQPVREDGRMKIRILALLCLVSSMITSAQVPAPQPPAAPTTSSSAQLPRGPAMAGSINDIMSKFIYPVGDEVFYISRNPPQNEKEWNSYEARMLMLAESGNLLMMPGRARDQDRWMRDARLLVDAGTAAYKAARARDVAAIEKLNDQMYNACVICHQDYRPNYRTRVPDPEGLAPLQPSPPQR